MTAPSCFLDVFHAKKPADDIVDFGTGDGNSKLHFLLIWFMWKRVLDESLNLRYRINLRS